MKKTQFLDYSHSKACDYCGATFYRDKRCTWKWWASARFCSRECTGKYQSQEYALNGPTLEEAFYSKVERGGPDECWRWSGYTDKDGYALVCHRATLHRAPRVAIWVSGRTLGDDEQACHSCGNFWCVNPAHIYPGTAKQNNSDKIKHGTHLVGEQCHTAKLTEKQVLHIRASGKSEADLAQEFCVTRGAIEAIRSRRTWKHLP